MCAFSWAILTGEYPPQPGGVSDYTRVVARALATAGDDVHVWAPPVSPGDGAAVVQDEGAVVHRLPDRFARAGRALCEADLRRRGPECRILVQYVPQAFGCRGMNVPLCLWLRRCGRRRDVWT